jgi:hypothetical protein
VSLCTHRIDQIGSSLLPVILVFALVRKQWAYARALALVCLIGLVLISPWTIRNYLLSGQLVLVHTSVGLNLVQGEAIGEQWTNTPFSTLAIWEEGRKQTEQLLAPAGLRPESPEGDAMLTGTILHRWWSSPVILVRHAATNGLTFWYLSESPLKSGVVIAMQIPLLILAGLGLRRMWIRGFSAHILLVAVVSFWLVHALIVGWLRYSVPVLPILILIAAAGAERLLPRVAPPGTA